MNTVLSYFEVIGHLLQFFFVLPATFSRVFQIVLMAVLIFLFATALRPRKWKWIVLCCAESLYFAGAMALLAYGFAQSNVGQIYYGLIAAVISIVIGFVTVWFGLRNPFSRIRARSGGRA